MPTTSPVIVPIRSRDDTKKGVDSVRRRLGGLASGAGGLVAGLGVAAAAGTAIAAFSSGVDAAANFETALTNIEARTELTEEGLDAVRQQALAMGRDTQFSASQAAEGMLELITSGSSAEEAISTISPVLSLAAAASLDLGQAADGVTDVMAQFGLGVDDAETVVNAFTQAAGSSSATAADLIDAMKNGGAVAAGYGLDVEQTAAAMAVLAENGLKGAEAGTALKSFFLNATRDTKESRRALDDLGIAIWAVENGIDSMEEAYQRVPEGGGVEAMTLSFYEADGSARDFNEVIADISTGLSLMSDEQANAALKDLAGSYGQVAARALVASGGIDDMQEKMGEQRDAAEVAQTQMDTLQARTDSLGSSMETLAIKVLTPLIDNALKPMVVFLTDALNAFNAWLDTEDAQNALAAVQMGFQHVWEAVQVFWGVLKNVVELVGAIMKGDWASAFKVAVRLVVNFVNGVIGLLETLYRSMLTFIQNILNSMIGFVNDALRSLPDFLKDNVYHLTGGQIDIKQGRLLQEASFANDFALPRVQLPAFAQDAGGGGTVINVNVRPNTLIGDADAMAAQINDLMRQGVVG